MAGRFPTGLRTANIFFPFAFNSKFLPNRLRALLYNLNNNTMKKAILSFAAWAILLSASAQQVKESEVPSEVKTAFKKAHADLKKIKWEKEGENYQAEFESGGTEQSVLMNATGIVLETE